MHGPHRPFEAARNRRPDGAPEFVGLPMAVSSSRLPGPDERSVPLAGSPGSGARPASPGQGFPGFLSRSGGEHSIDIGCEKRHKENV